MTQLALALAADDPVLSALHQLRALVEAEYRDWGKRRFREGGVMADEGIQAAIGALVKLHPNADPMRLARQVLAPTDGTQTRAELARWVLPLVREEIEHHQRKAYRNLEQGCGRILWEVKPSARTPLTGEAARVWSVSATSLDAALAFREQLRDGRLALGDGTRVAWWDATREQIAARIGFFRKHIAGCEQTLLVLEQAATILEEHDVDCLRDLPAGSDAREASKAKEDARRPAVQDGVRAGKGANELSKPIRPSHRPAAQPAVTI